jgi:hypothetical protein
MGHVSHPRQRLDPLTLERHIRSMLRFQARLYLRQATDALIGDLTVLVAKVTLN